MTSLRPIALRNAEGDNHIYSGDLFAAFPGIALAAFPLFLPFFLPSEALAMDPNSPSSLLCWKSQSGSKGGAAGISPPLGREKRVGFANKSQLSSSMCRAPQSSGSGLALGVPSGQSWGHVSCAKATQMLQLGFPHGFELSQGEISLGINGKERKKKKFWS